MHRDPRYIARDVPPTHLYDVGGYICNVPLGEHYIAGVPAATTFDAALAGRTYGIPGPFEFQPSDTCPKNFVIFDQTDKVNRVMFHPALVHKFSSSNLRNSAARGEECGRSKGKVTDIEQKCSSFKEDTEDINALLSSEEENDEEDEDDDLVSTGRTPDSPWEGTSADLSFLMEDMEYRTLGNASCYKSTPHSAGRSREGTENLFEALRGIIPGGDQLDTTALLDEAVRYLKSLKVEVEKLGIRNL